MESNAVSVGESERALASFASAYADGSLARADFDDVIGSITAASANPSAVANAFGVDDSADGSAIRSNMVDMYGSIWLNTSMADTVDSMVQKESDRKYMMRDSMIRALGMTGDDVRRLDFDLERGDSSSWLKAKEDYVFG